MQKIVAIQDMQFLSGGGEMGELTRSKNWDRTSLGSPEGWPQSLRTTLSIILNSKYPMFLWWGSELICFYNDAYRPSLGKEGKHPGILGMPGKEAWSEIWDVIGPMIEQVLTAGNATYNEDQLIPIYRNGHLEDVYWTFSFSPVNDETGRPAGVFVTCSETTQKVIMLSKVSEINDELLFALEATESGTFDYNPLSNKFSANARLKKWFGLPPTERIELTHALNAIADNDRARVISAIQQALDYSSGGLYDIKYTIIHPVSKVETIVHAKGKAWFNEENVAYKFNGTLQDVTEQEKAAVKKEELLTQLSRATQNYTLALTAGKLGAFELDTSTGKFECSLQCKLNFGLEEVDSLDYHQLIEMIHPEDREQVENAIMNSLKYKTIYDATYRLCIKNGETRWIHASGQPLYASTGVAVKMAGLTNDITAQKTLEDQIAKSFAEQKLFAQRLEMQVQQRTQELEQKNTDLAHANKELESFAYISSHDLQEPLRKIQTFATRFTETEEHNLSAAGKNYLDRMRAAAKRMQTLIEDLLAYSRTATHEKEFEKINLADIVDLVKEDLREEISQKSAIVETAGLIELTVIPFQFRQLLQNLLSNSLKFSQPDQLPIIKITAEHKKGSAFPVSKLAPTCTYCHLIIEDNGIGFDQEYNEKIFGLFQRLHGRSEFPGTGIGLAIVKKIVENHSGLITASGEINKGTRFDIYLPLQEKIAGNHVTLA